VLERKITRFLRVFVFLRKRWPFCPVCGAGLVACFGEDGAVGGDVSADSAGFGSALEEPAALRPDGAFGQGLPEGSGEDVVEGSAFAAASAFAPSLAARLGAGGGEAKCLFRRYGVEAHLLRLMGVDLEPPVGVGDGLVRQDDAEQDRSVLALGAWA